MKKHIKIVALLIGPTFEFAEINLMQQTHFGKEFGKNDYRFKTEGGIIIASFGDYLDVTYLSSKSFDRRTLYLPECPEACETTKIIKAAQWPAIKSAVDEYNNYEF